MGKTLKFDTFYNTEVTVTGKYSLTQLFDPRTTFIFKLADNQWVMYQYHFKEMKKAASLGALMDKSFGITEETFFMHAIKLNLAEANIISDIFLENDNYNLDEKHLYKMK
jgi:hypothetical protein|tara:strand:+ start:8980 stop:9309 length:330 start_codon:yes stop_codon:yes gene_type:complete